jgi:hypothetical protein
MSTTGRTEDVTRLTYLNPAMALDSMISIAKECKQYTSLIPIFEEAKQKIEQTSKYNRSQPEKVLNNPQALQKYSQLCSSQHSKEEHSKSLGALRAIETELYNIFFREVPPYPCGHLKAVCNSFGYSWRALHSDERTLLHTEIHENFDQVKKFIENYQKGEWGWLLQEHLLSLVDEVKVEEDVRAIMRADISLLWGQTRAVVCAVEEMWEIFNDLGVSESCEAAAAT